MNKLSKQQNSVSIVSTLPNTTYKEISIYNAYQNDKKLKEFSSKEDLMLMNSLIVRWANYVGVDTPEASQLNMLSNFIKEHFPSFNAFDIKECIGMLASQSLETDAEHYGKISPIYVSKVLKAYQEYKSEVVFKVRGNIEKIKETEVKPIPNEERIDNFKKLLTIAKKEIEQGLTYGVVDEITGITYPTKNTSTQTSTNKEITISLSFGASSPPLKEQIENQGFKLSDQRLEEAEQIMFDLYCLNKIGILKEKDLHKCFKRLNKKLCKRILAPMLKEGERAILVKKK